MALVWKDRVLETTTTTGTGTLTLAGAVTGYQTFAAVGDGNTCYYCVYAVDNFGNPSGVWEVGLGTYTASGTTLARTTVYANSSGTQVALDLAAGTKRVMLTAAAAHLTTIPVVNGGTGLTALGSALQVLRVNAGGTALEYGTISTGLTVGTTAITLGTSGRLLYDNGGVLGEAAAVTYATSTANLTVTASGAAVVPAVFKGATSQTANLTEGQNSAGTVVHSISPTGGGAFAGGVLGTTVYVGDIGATSSYGGIWFATATPSITNYAFLGNQNETNLNNPFGGVYINIGNTAKVSVTSTTVTITSALTQIRGLSSTSTAREQADIDTAWADSTDATRKARVLLRAWDTAARECIRLEASGSAAMLGFYGVSAVARQLLATGTGATVDDVITALQNIGILRQS